MGRRLSLLAVLAAVVAAPASTAGGRVEPPATTVSAPTQAMSSIVREVLGGIDSSFIRSVEVGRPPAGEIGPRDDPQLANAVWLSVDAVVLEGKVGMIQGWWETELLAGAVRELAARQALPPVLGLTIDGVYANGAASTCTAQGRIASGAQSSPASTGWTVEKLQASIAANAGSASGVTLNAVEIQQPLGYAAVIDMTMADATIPAISTAIRQVIGDPDRYDGVLFRVRDVAGTLLMEEASAARVPGWTAVGWTNPVLHPMATSVECKVRPKTPTGPVRVAEATALLTDWQADGRLTPNRHSCAAAVVERAQAVSPQHPKGSPLILALNNYVVFACRGKEVEGIGVGMSNREVATLAGAPVPWLSTTNRWIYRVATPRQGVGGEVGTDLVSLTVFFEGGRVTRLVDGRCLCGLPAMRANAR